MDFLRGNITGEFPAQMASNAENVFIWWRHHDTIGPSADHGESHMLTVEKRNHHAYIIDAHFISVIKKPAV